MDGNRIVKIYTWASSMDVNRIIKIFKWVALVCTIIGLCLLSLMIGALLPVQDQRSLYVEMLHEVARLEIATREYANQNNGPPSHVKLQEMCGHMNLNLDFRVSASGKLYVVEPIELGDYGLLLEIRGDGTLILGYESVYFPSWTQR